jgi:hypothetical protein
VIIALLRFIYLTLSNCAGFDFKTLRKEENQEKVQKRQKQAFTRSGEQSARSGELAGTGSSVCSHPTRSGEHKSSQRRAHQLAVASSKGLAEAGAWFCSQWRAIQLATAS